MDKIISHMREELPREKLMTFGPDCLMDRELISLILSSGNKKESVFKIANRIIHDYDREELVVIRDYDKLKKQFSIGDVHTSRLMAAVELGKRLFDRPISNQQVNNYQDIYRILSYMKDLKKEHFKGLYLNTRNFIIKSETISIGSLDSNIIHPREIFKPAIEYSAYSLIIAHNHPSGNPQPSNADIDITRRLVKIGELLQISIVDHVIIGQQGFFSFSKEGLLTKN